MASEVVGDEAVGGEGFAAEVASGEAGAADIHFARDAEGDGLLVLGVEDVDLEIGDRGTDDRAAVEVVSAEGAVSDMDGGFGDAIHVDEDGGGVAVPVIPWFEALHFEGFAAEDNVAEGLRREVRRGGAGEGFGGDELAKGAGGLVEDGDALFAEEFEKIVRAAGGEPGDDEEASAV